MTPTYALVIPTIGRPSLNRLLEALGEGDRLPAGEVIIVDDRPGRPAPLWPATGFLSVTVLRSGGRGPAAARNLGWRAARADWICFLDDDVVAGQNWCARLEADLSGAGPDVVGSQAKIVVPEPTDRRPLDDERRTLRLADARWITADMAYRRDALVACGGFDERFPRAYREDADLALRLTRAGGRIAFGSRESVHPIPGRTPAQSTVMSSVAAQRGNRDDALMRRKHGRGWRKAIGEGRGRLPLHLVICGAGLLGVLGMIIRRRQLLSLGWLSWLGLTAEFALRRIAAGPRSRREVAAMVISSALIPPVAVAQRIRGALRFRKALAEPPLAVLLDRDDTLIHDGPYLADPDRVRPLPHARRAVRRLRRHGLRLAVVSNQSGVAKGLISPEQLAAVNSRVEELLGPFDSWQVCPHDDGDGCACRKPAPGLVSAAADALDVHPGRCVMIGDTGGDMAAARAADADAILVPTRRTRRAEIADAYANAAVARSLNAAVTLVLKGIR
ncbi:HAD-IIIA family hydrolase [Mycolicibacter virginiensis]|uniref:HAD-IIIA family hydrolase n=1 Tax=Mycolicibacter virginiensis TaxID=1795032 RepID=UPI001F047F56|nr:HAD-IIIA family hydrolase [Mycolicibacter virginiensis]ULP46580.1 HAD-IIIA family hydrolase [Mycolicibacter virginiensis]